MGEKETSLTLRELAQAIDGVLIGDPDTRVSGLCSLDSAARGAVAVVWDLAELKTLSDCPASAIVTPQDTVADGCNLIQVADPRAALNRLLHIFAAVAPPTPGIEAGAVVSPAAQCADDVYIEAGARIDAGAKLCSGVQIHANAVIGRDVFIDESSIVHANVTIYPGTWIGKRVEIHSAAVIGCDGFGYEPGPNGGLRKLPHLGTVRIEDDVEIGAGTTIDRAKIGTTVIGHGVKIDNLVQVAHNCEVGAHTVLTAQVGLAGSVRLGQWVQLGGQTGVADHVTIAPGTRVGAKGGVNEDLAGGDWLGTPALPAAKARRAVALFARLPEIFNEIRSLRKRCQALEEELERQRSAPPQNTEE